MTNRPKAIGTAAETAVVRCARANGFPHADRLTLTGSQDRGDVGLCPGVVVEVKAGHAAERASDGLVGDWLVETERERLAAGAAVALLVTKRAGISGARADRWWAHLRLGQLTAAHPDLLDVPVRLHFGDALRLLRTAGWGEPLYGAVSAATPVPGVLTPGTGERAREGAPVTAERAHPARTDREETA
jgi:hypothetical protein